MELAEANEELTRAEQAIVDILTIVKSKDLTLDFADHRHPLLLNKEGETLCYCQDLRRITDKAVYFSYPQNATYDERDENLVIKGLGSIYYLLTAAALRSRSTNLWSDELGSGKLTDGSIGLWDKLEFLGLAQKSQRFNRFQIILPENYDALEALAKKEAAEIKATGKIEEAIAEIQDRLRRPNAGEILDKDQ